MRRRHFHISVGGRDLPVLGPGGRLRGEGPSGRTADQWEHVQKLYKGYGNAPLWVDEDGLLEPRADALVDALVQSTGDAIDIDAYPLAELVMVLDTIERAKDPTAVQWARTDLLLTTAYVSLAEDLLTGQIDPRTVGQSWHIDPQEERVDSAITLALRGKDMAAEFARMRPQEYDYEMLRQRLADYRKLASADSAADSTKKRLLQIAANLERYRWLPRTLGNKYILVNVPAFKLEGFEGGEKTIEMKVIVGEEYQGRTTPVFSDKMEYVVFRPYWNVTPTIAATELFPKFAAEGMPADYETYTENGELRLRQKPGEKNSLGLVKFLFPNDFNIYLHDTPYDKLFEKDVRAFSHGCIRLEKPAELAVWVLGWDRSRVDAAMHGANNRTVTLKEKIPVYITYMTAYVREGNLTFEDDLYGRDTRLVQAVAGAAAPSASAVRTVEALRRFTD
jgi:murein L,D-transpeptidase YcbB/YkuD